MTFPVNKFINNNGLVLGLGNMIILLMCQASG